MLGKTRKVSFLYLSFSSKSEGFKVKKLCGFLTNLQFLHDIS